MNNFEQEIKVRWSDIDQNGHVRHSAYYDYGAHARIAYFNKIGFDARKMQKLAFGPVLFKEECSFIRELLIYDTVKINLLQGVCTPNFDRWTLHHEVFNSKGVKCAHISVKGAWMDLSKRKLTLPPNELVSLLGELPQGKSFDYERSKG